MSIEQVLSDIKYISTKEDLNLIQNAVKVRWNQLESKSASQFRMGQKVYFISRKYGEKVLGTITRINQKTIVLKSGLTSWTVSPSLLKAE